MKVKLSSNIFFSQPEYSRLLEKDQKVVSPLTGFYTSDHEIRLDNTHKIRRATAKEKRIIKKLKDAKYILQPRRNFFVAERLGGFNLHNPFRLFDTLLIAIGLMKDYLVVEPPMLLWYHDGKLITLSRSVDLVGNAKCVFSSSETHDLIELFNRIMTKKDAFRVPIERFIRAERNLVQSSLENKTADSIIDMMIAFEALILRGEHLRNVKKPIAIATAMLIGKDDNERTQIINRLQKAYEFRNKIIHGTRPVSLSQSETEQLSKLQVKIAGYFKRSLLRLLKT